MAQIAFSVEVLHINDVTAVEISTRVERNGVYVSITYTYNPSNGMLTTDYGQQWRMQQGLTIGIVLDHVMASQGVGPGEASITPFVPIAVEVPVKPPQYAA